MAAENGAIGAVRSLRDAAVSEGDDGGGLVQLINMVYGLIIVLN